MGGNQKMDSKTNEAQKAIQEAMAALQRGDTKNARLYALKASKLAPEEEQPWLILAGLSEPAESLVYIDKARAINPDNQTARRALEWVKQKLKTPPDIGANTTEEKPELVPTGLASSPAEEALKIHETMHDPIGKTHLVGSPARARKSKFSPMLISVVGVVGLLVVALLAGLIFFRPQVQALFVKIFGKEGCNPNLVIGTQTFGLRTIQADKNGSLKFPNNYPEQAAWVQGTDTNSVFALTQTAENLILVSSLKGGETATVTRENCNSTSYSLALPVPEVLEMSVLLDQSSSGITIIMPDASGLSGFVVQGELQQETITSFNTPDASVLQAEISLLETTTSADGTTITVGISIYNYGQVAGTLTSGDVSLTDENGSVASLLKAEPTLPIQIAPGLTQTIYFTFQRPKTNTATLKILSAEYILEDY